MGVAGCREDLVSVDSDVPLNASSITRSRTTLGEAGNRCLFSATGRRRRWRSRYLRTVLPDQVARRSVKCLNDSPGIRQIHDAVVYQRRRFVLSGVVHRPLPGELKLVDVLFIDFLEWTITPRVVGPPPVEPIAWSRIPQHCLCDRTEILNLRKEPGSPPDRHYRNRKRNSPSHELPLCLYVAPILFRP